MELLSHCCISEDATQIRSVTIRRHTETFYTRSEKMEEQLSFLQLQDKHYS